MTRVLGRLLGDADIYRILYDTDPPSVTDVARRERRLLRDLRNCRRPLHCRLRRSAMTDARITAEAWLATDHIPTLPPPGLTAERAYADNWHCRDTARHLAHEGIPYDGYDIAATVAKLRVAYYRCPPQHAQPHPTAVALAVASQTLYEQALRSRDANQRTGPQPSFSEF